MQRAKNRGYRGDGGLEAMLSFLRSDSPSQVSSTGATPVYQHDPYLNETSEQKQKRLVGLSNAEPQKTIVLDPSSASMRLGAEGINPADYGLVGTDETIKQLGDYGIASGGAFYETPGIQQGREEKADFDAANLLFDAEENDAKRLNKTLTANQYSKLMAEADTSQVALDQLDQVLATFEVEDGGVDRGFTVWSDQVTANAKNFFGQQADRDEFRLMSRDAKLQQIIGLFRTEIVGPGIVTEYDAERILKSVGGNVGAFQNPDIVKEQLDILRQQKIKALNTQKRQLDYFSRSYPGLYNSSVIAPGVQGSSSPSSISAGAGQNTYEVNY